MAKIDLAPLPPFDPFSDPSSLSKWCKIWMHVLEGSRGSLLSYSTAVGLGILDIQLHHISSTPMCEQLLRQYPSLFEGIGKLKGIKAQLHIDTKVTPVAQKARQIPFHLRKKVEYELKLLEEQHIIERVDGPTPWISPLVLIPKKMGGTHMCRHA